MTGRRIATLAFQFLGLAAIGFLGASAIAGVVLAEGAMRLPVRPLDHAASARVLESAAALNARRTDVAIAAADGQTLRGWRFDPERPNGDVVVLLHGQADNRLAVSGSALWLLGLGYTVLTPDSRGHGDNGSALTTYGVREADDVRRWLGLLDDGRARRVFLVGQSMGAAVALLALPAPAVCGVVAESPFASFREIAYDRVAAGVGLPLWLTRVVAGPSIEFGLAYARVVRGAALASVDPAGSVRRAGAPVLLVHGQADVNIPPRHSFRIARGADRVEIWTVPGATHTRVWAAAPEEYQRRMLAFLRRATCVGAFWDADE
jgi:hypothetical protein